MILYDLYVYHVYFTVLVFSMYVYLVVPVLTFLHILS